MTALRAAGPREASAQGLLQSGMELTGREPESILCARTAERAFRPNSLAGHRHSREGGNPGLVEHDASRSDWIPAFGAFQKHPGKNSS